MSALPIESAKNEIAAESNAILASAQQLQITDARSYEAAGLFGREVIVPMQRKIIDFFAPHKKRAHETWRGLCDDEKRELGPVEEAEKIVKRKRIEWKQAEERRQTDERREREAAAKKLEEERRLAEAIEVEEESGTAAAIAVLDEPVPAPFVPPAAAPAIVKTEGIASRKKFKADRTSADVLKLASFVVQHPEWKKLLVIDWKEVDKLAQMMGADFNFPGIAIYEEETEAWGRK